MQSNTNSNFEPNVILGELLIKIWNFIVTERVTIILITVLSIFLSFIYIFFSTSIYKSEVFFLPEDEGEIQKLNDLDLLLDRGDTYDPETVFLMVQQRLASRKEMWNFFTENALYNLYGSFNDLPPQAIDIEKLRNTFNQFYEDYSHNSPKNFEKNKSFSVSLSLKIDKEYLKSILLKYIDYVNSDVKKRLIEDITAEQMSRINMLQDKIDSMRNKAKKRKQDRVVVLTEAINIARELRLEKFPGAGEKASIEGVSNQGLPLYYLGYRLLEAEKKALLSRVSDDPFISGIRDVEEQLNRLKKFKITEEEFSIVKIDKESNIIQRIWPKDTLIVVIAALMGFILSVIYIIIRNGINYSRADEISP